jgi:hypothetical protein
MVILDATIVLVALSSIQADIGFSSAGDRVYSARPSTL